MADMRFRGPPTNVALQSDSNATSGPSSVVIPAPAATPDDLLIRAGSAEAVDEACWQSSVGKLLPNALYIHRTALESLDPLPGSRNEKEHPLCRENARKTPIVVGEIEFPSTPRPAMASLASRVPGSWCQSSWITFTRAKVERRSYDSIRRSIPWI
jgi:hypothetical protein